MSLVTWAETELFKAVFAIAKNTLTKDDLIAFAVKSLQTYTEDLKHWTEALHAEHTYQAHQDYADKFASMAIDDVSKARAGIVAKRISENRPVYEKVQARTNVPWQVIAVIHYRESDLALDCYLGNGQPLNRKTTETPKGRGPFKTFEDGAVDALTLDGLENVSSWAIGPTLYALERFNGLGYQRRGLPSPYVWSGSNVYKVGKFVADGRFDPHVIDKQLGCAVLLKLLPPLVNT